MGIKEIYEMRHSKMAEWMENVEKAIARIMADKVYTSAEFKRERDNFQALCKDLERTEVKKWLNQILEILMAERAKTQQETENAKLEVLIKKHEELIPTVQKTSLMVDLYWKCYAYGDELKPHIEFLDGIMLSSTRDIAPSCVENVDELIDRQEKSLVQLKTKRSIVKELIEKGKKILENPDKPRFLEGHVSRIELGWDDTKQKAQDRLTLLTETKDAWEGYAVNNETIATDFEKAEVVGRFEEKVAKVAEFVNQLNDFDASLKTINDWMATATAELEDIKTAAGSMLPEDRVARTMDLQEDIAAKVEILKSNAARELELLPQGDKVPQDAQDYKDELNRIIKYVDDLAARCKKECDSFSEDVKYWAEYRTGIKEFTPWLVKSEGSCNDGLSKPSNLDEVKALHEKVSTFDKTCLNYLKVLEAADSAAKKMTTHEEADKEVAALKERYNKVKGASDQWVAKVDTLLKEWTLLDTTVTELNPWVAKDKTTEGENQFSLEKMESTLGELKNIFKQKEKLVEGL